MKAPEAELARPDGRTYLHIMSMSFRESDYMSPAFIALYRLLYELVWAVVHAKLTRQDILSLLKDAKLVRIWHIITIYRYACVAHAWHHATLQASFTKATNGLVDVLWIIGSEVEANEKGREKHSSSEWQNLSRFVKALVDENVVSQFDLKSSLEIDLLHDAGLVAEAPLAMTRRIVRINTKTLYTQMKYNLLREESEGFSKVLCLLHTGVTKDQLEATKTDLLALIGFFDLDANRVLDLVLDAYEMHPQNDCFVDLLGSFKRESLPHVLGFKFQFYMRSAEGGAEQSKTPRSLYRLAATLIDKKLLDLDALFPHLAPTKAEIVTQAKAHFKKLEDKVKSFGKINLAAKADSAEDGDKDAEKDESANHNQVYGLIVGMLEIGCMQPAFEMIEWFRKQGVNPVAYPPLVHQMCVLVRSLISKLFEPLSLKSMGLVVPDTKSKHKKAVPALISTVSSHSTDQSSTCIKPLTSYDELVSTVFPILEILSGQLHQDQFLFVQLLRVMCHMMEEKTKSGVPVSTAVMQQVRDLVVKSFFPALSLQTSNPSTAFQLWDLIKLFPFEQRYRMYQQWQEAYASSPEMQLMEAQSVQSTRAVMRRLTADRAKPSARSLTQSAHSNPLIVFRTMLRQIQSYDNLIQPVVESFKFITPLGMDVLSFVLVSELSKSGQSMKSDGTNISLWLASLANFSGSFYRKYPNVELAGLLQYLIQRLQNWESVDLVVLSELLSKMGSCISFEDISLSQLEAQAGGPHLWHEPADPKLMNRRAIPRLRDALIKRDLALPLCVLICQMRSKIEFQDDSPLAHLKLIGRLYDTCQMTLSQLLQFLNGVVDPLVYTKMMPSISTLVRDSHVPPELAMTLVRPAIRYDDPVLRKAPRSVHVGGVSNANVNTDNRPTWFMHSPELLNDVAQAFASDSTVTNPFMGMTKDMYVMFWGLTLYDIHVPFSQYEAEILRLRNSVTTAVNATSGNGALTSAERKKIKEKANQMIDKLTNEQKDQVAHRKRVFERLEEKKSSFFSTEPSTQQTATNQLLQRCVIPRALLSPEDALFCAKFMERLHQINAPSFNSLQYYSNVNLKLPSIVLCVTEREAGNYGIFFKETLSMLYRWYQSSVMYEEEALQGKLGFSVSLVDRTQLNHRQYKLAYAKWHRWMERVYSSALASKEYMPIRNTLVVLSKIIDVFPSHRGTAEKLLEIVDVLTKEDREDIKIMAKRYFALLTKRKSSLVDDRILSNGPGKKTKSPREQVPRKPVDRTEEPEKVEPKETPSRSIPRNQEDYPEKPSTGAPGGGGSSSRGRTTPSDSRQDIESGEVVSSKTEPKGSSGSGRNGGVRDSSASKLKRRDLDRPVKDERHDDEPRGRRPAPSPGRESNESGSQKRGRSRDRSMEKRKDSREREKIDQPERERDTSGSRGAGGRDDRLPPTGSDRNDSRKRQRVEASEAALRRQLTEKKKQDERKPPRDKGDDSSNLEGPPPSSRNSDGGDKQSAANPRMVSLVSRKRGQPPADDAEDRARGSPMEPPPQNEESGGRNNNNNKRRMGGGGGSNSDSAEPSNDMQQQPDNRNKRSQEDNSNKKNRNRQQKPNGDNYSGGGSREQQYVTEWLVVRS